MKHFFFLLFLIGATTGFAQSDLSWKKLEKLADENLARAEYANAAEQYKQAWQKKPSNLELIYKAGKAYTTIKDYQNAADAFEKVKDKTDFDPMIGLLYGRALKQSGAYAQAARELSDALNTYQGPDAEAVRQVLQTEIRGAELGVQFDKIGDDPGVKVSHLGSNVNTIETEFAPLPFNDEVLYFSSTVGNRAEIYRSTKSAGQWGPAVTANLPEIDGDHYCNGTLTPDNKRFYFTICSNDETWGGLTTRCEIYLTRREDNAWTEPERLRDYINMEGATTTHPNVVHDGEAEILYFASNREGGKGGMDIWYTSRAIASDDIDFTFPVNAGSKVNSPGDEITPFYDQANGQLYFAANGAVGLGGYDIFRIEGRKSGWKVAENAGTPINSPADDYFYTQSPSGQVGFLVSNRNFGMEKISTVDEDIFELSFGNVADQFASGKIYSKNDGTPLRDVAVALYDVTEAGSRKLVSSQVFDNGTYRFKLIPDMRYELEAQKTGYATESLQIDLTQAVTSGALNQPLFLAMDDKTLAENTAQDRSDTQRMQEEAAKQQETEAAQRAEQERLALEAEAAKQAEADRLVLEAERAKQAEADRLALEAEQAEADRRMEEAKKAAAARAEAERLAAAQAQSDEVPTGYADGATDATIAAPAPFTDPSEVAPPPAPAPPTSAPTVATTSETPPEAPVTFALEDDEPTPKTTPFSSGNYKGYYDRSNAEPWKSAMPERRDQMAEAAARKAAEAAAYAATAPNYATYEPEPYVPASSYAPVEAEPSYSSTTSYSAVGDYRIKSMSPMAPASMEGFPLTVHDGTYYKVQVIAVETFNIDHPRYAPVRELATIETEYLEDLNWVRVLLGPIFDYQEAQALKEQAQQYTNFERAFVVKYIDGERITIIR